MSRRDSQRYIPIGLNVQPRRRFVGAENKSYVRDRAEQGLSLSPSADASGTPNSLTLLSRRALKRATAQAATAESLDLRWLAKELQLRLRNKTLENEILREALEAARETRDHCTHRHRR
jgi:hypothetical protein